MMLKRITLLGPPGAGKGTQAKLIAQKSGLVHLSTGDILRDEVARSTELGRAAKEYMDRGDLVPDQLIIDMIRGRIAETDGFILDGFPRTVAQAEALSEIVSIDSAINIALTRENVIERLSSRRVCSECGRIYNLLFNPSADKIHCDTCGGELFQRDDDQQAVIENRYDVYMQATAPLIDFYSTRGLLREVDGAQPTEAVLAAIMDCLSS
ncbi:MAG: adenylate kinase [Candidatus Bipolaricaulota bacterium]|nr:adenylate kinase [Candidatus Bipolaricaulota bacterium]